MRAILNWLGVIVIVNTLTGCTALKAATHETVLFSPYKDVNIAPDVPLALANRTPIAEPGMPSRPQVDAITLAFASGNCGDERWGKLDAQKVVNTHIKALKEAGMAYLISTGGEGGVFTCSSDEGMEKFVSRYESPMLIGFDFDIEASQSENDITALVQRIKKAQVKRPHLRISFTLATFASSDASGASLNEKGQQVMKAISNAALDKVFINLMVMDFGPAEPKNCVVREGHCDMNASAQQAVLNFNKKYGVPLSRIELTPMIGINDVVANIFTPNDAFVVARFAKDNRLGGLHYWSMDRDKPCPGGSIAVSDSCSSMNEVSTHGFQDAFLRGLK